MKRYSILWFILGTIFLVNSSVAQGNDCVILLHGLARTSFSMLKLAWYLERQGYVVMNYSYPSTRKAVTGLANDYVPGMVQRCLQKNPKQIHVVTHSIGGLVIQQYLKNHTIPRLKHIVMLAPPNHGSPWADLLQDKWYARWILGPAISDLTTRRSVPEMQYPRVKLGVIAGNVNLNPFLGLLFQEPNDGKVAVSSTQMQGMSDFIVLPVNHTFIMFSTRTETQVTHFLRYGSFIKQG